MKEDSTDFLDDFDGDTAEAAPVVEQAPEPQADQQPRGPDGKFAEKVQQGVKPEAPPAPGAEPPAADDGSPNVPRSALLAERQKRQALEAELAKLRTPAAAAQQPQTPQKGPEFSPPEVDFDDDPRTYVQSQIHSIKMQQSQFFAAQQSSPEAVAEAWAAFDAACNVDPAVSRYSETLVNHPHPMGEVLKWHGKQKQLQMLEQAGGLDKLKEQWLAEALAGQGQQPVQAGAAPQRQMQPKPATPPSLANGGAGAFADPGIPTEDEDFNGLFEGARKPRKR